VPAPSRALWVGLVLAFVDLLPARRIAKRRTGGARSHEQQINKGGRQPHPQRA